MTTTAALYAGAAASVAQTWTTPANAVGVTTGTYATFTSATASISPVIECSAYNAQASVPAGATINSVTVTVRHFVANTTWWSSERAQLYVGTTAKGTLQTMTLRGAVGEDSFVVTGLTYADLADLRVRYNPLHSASAISSTANLDRVGIVIDYTPAAVTPTSFPILKEVLVAGVDSGGNASALTCTTAADTPADAWIVAINGAAFDGAVATAPTTGTWVTEGTAPNPVAGSNSRERVWGRFAGTAAAQTVTVNNGASSGYGHVLIVLVWTNVNPTTPWDNVGSFTSSVDNAYAIPAITTAAPFCTEVVVYTGLKYGDGAPGGISHPPGMAEKLDWAPDSASYIVAGVAIATQSSAVTTPARTVAGSATGWAAAHFAIRGGTAATGGPVEPIVEPDPVPTANPLTKWSAALGTREAAPADVLVIGDSITAGASATTLAGRWVNKLLAKLRTLYPTPAVAGGEGYLSAYYNATFTDGWTFAGNYAFFTGYGWGHRSVQLGAPTVAPDPVKALGSIQRTVSGTSVDVQFLTFTDYGTLRVLVDGVQVATAAANSPAAFTDTGRLRVTFATRGSHTVRVEWLSGGNVFVTGLMVYDQDENAGVRLIESGEGGATSAGWSPIDTPANAQLLGRVAQLNPDLVIIELGVNDWYTNLDPATYKQNVLEIIQGIRDNTVPDPDFLLVAGYTLAQPGNNSATWQQYVNQLKAITNVQSDVAFVDLSQVANPGTAFGYSSTDQVHPTDAGHTLYAQMVYDGLVAATPAPAAGTSRPGQFFVFF